MPNFIRLKPAVLLIVLGLSTARLAGAQVDVLTQHNDNGRTGANLHETILSPANVNNQAFGKLAFRIVDGNVYAQPLIVSDARIAARPNTPTNVAIVATEHNSVYAFDANDTNQASTAAQLWHTGPNVLGTPLNYTEVYSKILGPGESCSDLTTEIGITSTPVIALTKSSSPKEGVVFVVAKSKSGAGQVYKLFALGLADGQRKGPGTIIEGEVKGTGFGAQGAGPSAVIHFDPVVELNRPALLLHNNVLYVAFGGACDRPHGNDRSYHGWLFAYDVSDPATPKKLDVFSTSPNGKGGENEGRAGIWMSGQGPAVDDGDNIYLVTGDGTYNGATDFGDSVLKLKLAAGKIQVLDWYSPQNREDLKSVDVDLGSSGVVIVPHSHLLITGGKEGRLYLIDRNNLGHGAAMALESFQVTHDPVYPAGKQHLGGNQYNIHGSPIVWFRGDHAFVYVNGEEDPLKQFKLVVDSGPNGWRFDTPPEFARSTESAPYPNFPKGMWGDPSRGPTWMPGGFVTVSADGSSDESQKKTAIVWDVMPYAESANSQVVRGVLRAFDASQVSAKELWDSENTGHDIDRLGQFAKFVAPTVANGKVYLGTFQAESIGPAGLHTKRLDGDEPALVIYGPKN